MEGTAMQLVRLIWCVAIAGQTGSDTRYQESPVPPNAEAAAAVSVLQSPAARQASPAAGRIPADAGGGFANALRSNNSGAAPPRGADRAATGASPAANPARAATPYSHPGGSSAIGQPEGLLGTSGAPLRAKPSTLVETLFKQPVQSELSGRPLTLAEAAATATSRAQQSRRVSAYWELSAAIADYHLAVREGVELAGLHGQIADASASWDAAAQKVRVRRDAAYRAARAAQDQMRRLLGQEGQGAPPIAVDLPHGGRYDGRYENLFRDRPSAAARQLNEILALRYNELRGLADDEAEAVDWLHHVRRTQNQSTRGEGLLRAYDLLSLRRRAFVATVCDYNQRIAAYAELATPQRVAVPRLVAMHIRNGQGLDAYENSVIRRASAEESSSVGRTFAEEPDRSLRRKPVGKERSILSQGRAATQ